VLHLAIDPGRESLNARIEARAEAMIRDGLLREVRGLRERGYSADLRPMQAIGYRHMQPVVDGADTLVNALEAIKVDTRRFARRQRTWLRPIPDVHWHDPADSDAIMDRVADFLANPARPMDETEEGTQPGSDPGLESDAAADRDASPSLA